MSEHTEPNQCPVRSFNLETDPALAQNFHERCDELRDEVPIFFSETPGFYALTTMEGIDAALRDSRRFSNDATMVWKKHRESRLPFRVIPAQLNPPEHTPYRQLLHRVLSPRAIQSLEDVTRTRAREILRPLKQKRTIDFMKDFAEKVPTYVFVELLGLPAARTQEFVRLAYAFHHQPPDTDPDGSKIKRTVEAIMELLDEAIASRQNRVGEDIISELARANINGEPISGDDLRNLTLQVFAAGLDTVANGLGFFVLQCARNPEIRHHLVAHPQDLPLAIDESLRLYSQVSPSRMVAEDTIVEGIQLRKGDFLLLPLACANRDPTAFEDAREFKVDRRPNRHIAFGAGPHRCPGAALASLEMRIALEEWRAQFPNYSLPDAAAVQRHATGVIGIDHLPLTVNQVPELSPLVG